MMYIPEVTEPFVAFLLGLVIGLGPSLIMVLFAWAKSEGTTNNHLHIHPADSAPARKPAPGHRQLVQK